MKSSKSGRIAPQKNNVVVRNHKQAFRDSSSQLRATPISTLITCIVMAMTLLLATTLFLTLKIFQHVTQKINANNQVTIYLKPSSPDSQINTWLVTLRSDPIIREVSYVSPEQALKELVEQSDYQNILENIDQNPLPPVLLIKFKAQDKELIKTFVRQLRVMPLVETVHLNYEWFDRLFALLKLGRRLTGLLMTLFGLGILFIVSHTIQGATQKNHQEMTLLQLIGARTPYVRRPFLYLGCLLGLGAGFIALLLLFFISLSLKQPIQELLSSYQLEATPSLMNFKLSLSILCISSLLGWLGAWIAFYKHTKTH